MQVRGSLYKKEIKGAETHEHEVSYPQTLCGILWILFIIIYFFLLKKYLELLLFKKNIFIHITPETDLQGNLWICMLGLFNVTY
jgi:hypothetical protein